VIKTITRYRLLSDHDDQMHCSRRKARYVLAFTVTPSTQTEPKNSTGAFFPSVVQVELIRQYTRYSYEPIPSDHRLTTPCSITKSNVRHAGDFPSTAGISGETPA
jgi:hypothetical protein